MSSNKKKIRNEDNKNILTTDHLIIKLNIKLIQNIPTRTAKKTFSSDLSYDDEYIKYEIIKHNTIL